LDRGARYQWIYSCGGSSGGGGNWDLRPIYHSLAAAYGWTYREIDEHTLQEVNDLFSGWKDHPPVYVLVKAIVEGFGGGKKTDIEEKDIDQLQRESRGLLPILRGTKDPGLPKSAPVFDLDQMRIKNQERIKANLKLKVT
jgi:hypothetical protein